MATLDPCGKVDNAVLDTTYYDVSETIEGAIDDELEFLIKRLEDAEFYRELPDNAEIEKQLSSRVSPLVQDADYHATLRGWYGQVNKPRWCPKQSKYGARGGEHEGVDIALPSGTRLRSLFDGYLEWKPNGGSIGHRVWINFKRSGLDYTLIYGHLDDKIGEAPRSVKPGEEVAIAGCTGNTTYCPKENCLDRVEDHVHIKLVGKNGHFDPVPFIGWNLRYYDDSTCEYLKCP